ncbi:MAG: hypothetical protein HON68_00420 [Gammaproteobacteria bacterium]|jgi:hypothetical protein|nr:hypothetical protein [Gammaproteobacteria bacterium]MBT3489264.1 hypothetical protein [Gammaproteobacteria bacterium]MBT3717802.1 hypothetical protein [Gammaproteobacteria bacterium]MBT3843612.1 hypothetical protein [Gammaproteobacteria bacterium]MBT3894048.1 hypothetical protein [Gammaproteobacteria bacterium]
MLKSLKLFLLVILFFPVVLTAEESDMAEEMDVHSESIAEPITEPAEEEPVENMESSKAETVETQPVSAKTENTEKVDQGGLYMEINKLEQRDELCVAYVRFSNKSDIEFSEFKSELFAFDRDEIITAHFLADFQQVMANKTVVKLVPMKATTCTDVGSILLNRMTSCKSGEQDVPDCLRRLTTGAKGSIKLFK